MDTELKTFLLKLAYFLDTEKFVIEKWKDEYLVYQKDKTENKLSLKSLDPEAIWSEIPR